MSFQMLKRTRKRRGGDLYAGQLDPAIQAATELATVLQKIKDTLPSDTNPSDSAASASSVPNTPPNASTSDSSVPAPAASTNTAPDSIASNAASTNTASSADTSDSSVPASDTSASDPNLAPSASAPNGPLYDTGTNVPYGTNKWILYNNIVTILNNMINNPDKYNKKNVPNTRLQKILDQIKSAQTQQEVTTILNADIADVVGQGVSKQYFSMKGGTKKRRMRRTKRKTMRRTMRKTMRKY